MSPIPQPGWWRRLRHSRGFGVHSPSAYRFIREVLCEPLPFYGYELADAHAAAWPGGSTGTRLLLRLLARFDPPAVALCLPGRQAVPAAEIVRATCPRAVVAEGRADTPFWVVGGCSRAQAETAAQAAAAGATLYLPAPTGEGDALLLETIARLPYGHTFVNGAGATVYVGLRGAPRERFDVRF